MSTGSDESSEFNIFEEPDDYKNLKNHREQAVLVHNVEIAGFSFCLHVVPYHALWAHHVWNASKCLAEHFYENPKLVQNKSVIEFGAAAALPSIVCAKLSAKSVLVTDYPEDSLLQNIQQNLTANLTQNELACTTVAGHIWGKPSDQVPLTEPFDLVILSDLTSNHSAHVQLLEDVQRCTNEKSSILVAFSHHRPWKVDADLNFFALAKHQFGFKVEKLFEKKYSVMFEKDPGDEEIRKTVHVYEMKK